MGKYMLESVAILVGGSIPSSADVWFTNRDAAWISFHWSESFFLCASMAWVTSFVFLYVNCVAASVVCFHCRLAVVASLWPAGATMVSVSLNLVLPLVIVCC